MTRYSTSPDDDWVASTAGSHEQLVGFPYTFPFYFDRADDKNAVSPTEDWGTDVGVVGRYGTKSEDAWSSGVATGGRYG